MKINLITVQKRSNNFLDKVIGEFEDSIIMSTNIKLVTKPTYSIKFYKIVNQILLKLKGININFRKDKHINFTIGMGPDFAKLLPFSLNSRYNSIYIFDAWPQYFNKIENAINTYQIRHIFFSSKQVSRLFQKKNFECKFSYIPEAIKIDEYRFEDYGKKSIDIIQFGRKYDLYHNIILQHTINKNYNYFFEKIKGEIIFPKHEDFINSLASTKISICIPSNITHPERSGDISTMTVRYLQSMASKCLILGILPYDMKELFEYNPIIEIDLENPLEQLDNILKNFNDYIPLIEKNFQEICDKHSWRNRWEKIEKILND